MPTMPNIVGRDLQDATAMLEAAGVIDLTQIGYFGTWPVEVDWLTDQSVEPNTVISQEPAAYGDATYLELFDIGQSTSLDSVALGDSGHGISGNPCALTASLTGWGLIPSAFEVAAPPFAFGSEAPSPGGYGFFIQASQSGPLVSDLYYSAPPTGLSFNIGVVDCDIVADFYARFWRYDTVAGTYSLLSEFESPAVVLTSNTPWNINSWTQSQDGDLRRIPLSNTVQYFDGTDALFIDLVANITSNTPAGASPVIQLAPEFGQGMMTCYLQKFAPNVVDVNTSINLEVASLPVSVIYP